MSDYHVIHQQDFQKVPWKNGQGFTYEIDKLSEPSDPEAFLWRLSIAEVKQSGDFSFFNGYQRNISILSGGGMYLNVDGIQSPELSAFQSFQFAGEAQTYCTLTGPELRDFNVIYRDPFQVSVDWMTPSPQPLTIAPHTTCFIISGRQTSHVRTRQHIYHLSEWELLKITPSSVPEKLQFIECNHASVVGIIMIRRRVS
ncbi:HutD family protein [Celerinatantimonas sp. YJH-8]|uniref:HutD/Ves family protein n=1 Tax=Celerinatantimonas sp. YJH-8 TaxID=3228714 RepID=UPI0038BEF545